MSRLENTDGDTCRDLVTADVALLIFGRADCVACALWKEELEAVLAEDGTWPHVRFGGLPLDREGLTDVQRTHSWIADVCELPTNVLWRHGVKQSTWLGGGANSLKERLESERPRSG